MPTIKIHNTETNEVIEREMNAEELAQYEIEEKNNLALIQESIKAGEKRSALFNKLGITEEEARLLIGGNQ